MNAWDILILILVGLMLAGAFYLATRKAKSGGCSCGCENCNKKCNNIEGEK